MFVSLTLAFVLLLLLVLMSGILVDILERYVFHFRVGKSRVVMVLVGLFFALPELFVGIASSLSGKPQMGLGTLVGANIANLSFVVGGLAILVSSVPVVGEYLKKDFWITGGLALMPLLMLVDGELTQIEGLFLIIMYFVYAFGFLREKNFVKLSKKQLSSHEKWGLPFVFFLAVVIMAGCSWQLVQGAIRVSALWGVSWYWIGLVMIGVGTTLPEILLMVVSRKKSKASIVLADLLDSVVLNSTIIIGIVAVISPISLHESIQRGLTGIFLVAVLGLFWLFTKTKKKLERWEGVVLIGVYLMFIGLQVMFA